MDWRKRIKRVKDMTPEMKERIKDARMHNKKYSLTPREIIFLNEMKRKERLTQRQCDWLWSILHRPELEGGE